jgi:hypothetical protein
MSDRTKPPPRWAVEYVNAEGSYPCDKVCAPVAPHGDAVHGDETSAIATAWREHDRIKAEALREAARLAREGLPVCTPDWYPDGESVSDEIADWLDARADGLDPGDPKGTP